jgi:hypothetical protein
MAKVLWRSKGNSFATDYTVGDDPCVKFKSLKFDSTSVESIEAKVLSDLATLHGVEASEINVIHIIRIME